MPRWLDNWLARHRHPASLALHAVGIPLLPLAGWLAVIQLADGAWSLWWRPAGLFILSYLLQWVGHGIEGNEMGEVLLIRKLLAKSHGVRLPADGRNSSSRGLGQT